MERRYGFDLRVERPITQKRVYETGDTFFLPRKDKIHISELSFYRFFLVYGREYFTRV